MRSGLRSRVSIGRVALALVLDRLCGLAATRVEQIEVRRLLRHVSDHGRAERLDVLPVHAPHKAPAGANAVALACVVRERLRFAGEAWYWKPSE